MTAIISFGVSFFCLASLFLFKAFEMRRSIPNYRRIREMADNKVVHVSQLLSSVPHTSRVALGHVFHSFVCWISEIVLRVVRFVERKLLKFVNMVKGRIEINREKGSASLFLKEISNGKKKSTTPGDE